MADCLPELVARRSDCLPVLTGLGSCSVKQVPVYERACRSPARRPCNNDLRFGAWSCNPNCDHFCLFLKSRKITVPKPRKKRNACLRPSECVITPGQVRPPRVAGTMAGTRLFRAGASAGKYQARMRVTAMTSAVHTSNSSEAMPLNKWLRFWYSLCENKCKPHKSQKEKTDKTQVLSIAPAGKDQVRLIT